MALWDSSVINSNETAKVFNQLASKKAVPMVRKKNGLLYAFLGKMEVGGEPGGGTGFQRLNKVTGKNIEVQLLGKLPAPATVADANQIDTATLTFTTDYWGGAEFALAHYQYTHPIPDSEYDRFEGDEAKTLSYIDDVMDLVMLGYEKVWGTAFWVTGTSGAPSRTILGSVPFAVAGNNTTGAVNWASNGSSYGTIDRTVALNADFRGTFEGGIGDLTLKKIRDNKNTVKLAGGLIKLGASNSAVYGKVEQLVEAYTEVNYDKTWSEFGGEYVRYAGITFVLDNYAPAGTLALLEPESWGLWMQATGMTRSGIVFDPSRRGTWVLPTRYWMQSICKCPSHNALLVDITS